MVFKQKGVCKSRKWSVCAESGLLEQKVVYKSRKWSVRAESVL